MSDAAIWISAKCSPAQTSFQAYHSWTLMKCPAARQLVMGDSKHCDKAPCPPCPCVHVWWSPMITDDGLWLWICEVPAPGAPRQQHSYKSHKSGWKYQLRQRQLSEKTVLIWLKWRLICDIDKTHIDNLDMFLGLLQIFQMTTMTDDKNVWLIGGKGKKYWDIWSTAMVQIPGKVFT